MAWKNYGTQISRAILGHDIDAGVNKALKAQRLTKQKYAK